MYVRRYIHTYINGKKKKKTEKLTTHNTQNEYTAALAAQKYI